MQIYKFAFELALAAAALAAVVLLSVFGNADIAILVAVAAGLVGMYVLRHHARGRIVYGERPASVGDPSEPESRGQQRPSDGPTGPNREGTMAGPFYGLPGLRYSTRHSWRRGQWTW